MHYSEKTLPTVHCLNTWVFMIFFLGMFFRHLKRGQTCVRGHQSTLQNKKPRQIYCYNQKRKLWVIGIQLWLIFQKISKVLQRITYSPPWFAPLKKYRVDKISSGTWPQRYFNMWYTSLRLHIQIPCSVENDMRRKNSYNVLVCILQWFEQI